jgi:hypothetical protein
MRSFRRFLIFTYSFPLMPISLPPAPELPRSMWLTGGALLLALLSYGFRAELWPIHPAAGGWSLVLLPLLVVAVILQMLNVLHYWLEALFGPGWLRLLLRAGLAVAQVGLALLIGLVLLGSLIALPVLA